MANLEPELQRLIDESAIRNILNLYPRALDRHDHELLASLFHPDAIDEHGVYNGSASGYVDLIRSVASPGSHWMHHNGTQIIEIEGNFANAETYALAFYRQPETSSSGESDEIFLRVRYLDKLEKREGQWRISHRRVVYSPCHVLPIKQDYPFSDQCLKEGGKESDPVYQW